jgi:PAS domain S-box-containing protein/diguanylate cyclase (GGDEF)-like protein
MSKQTNFSLFARGRRQTDDRLAERMSVADDAVFLLRHGQVESASHTVLSLFGWEPELCNGRALSELFGLETYAILDELQTAAEAAGGHSATHRGLAVENIDGETVFVDATISDLRHDGDVNGTVLTIHDVTDRVEMERRIKEIEHHDPLTETANAAMFEVLLSRAMQARSSGGSEGISRSRVGVVVVGTPGLEEVNRQHGIEVGDAVLVEVARRLASVLRTGDHVSRVTNARFAMIVNRLDRNDPTTDLSEVTDRLTDVLAKSFVINGSAIELASTVRSACSTADETSNELLGRVFALDAQAVN